MGDGQEITREWWERRYQDAHTPWDREGVSPALHHWLEMGVLTPGRILVPGCGRGHEVVELARLGFAVTALDVAPTAVACLQERLQEQGLCADVRQVDLFAWEPDDPYDAIYDQTSLCAIVPSQWPYYVQRLHSWLRPGGQLVILFMQTERPGGPPFHCELSEMRRLFPPGRWHWPDDPPLDVPHSVGFVEKGYVLARQG